MSCHRRYGWRRSSRILGNHDSSGWAVYTQPPGLCNSWVSATFVCFPTRMKIAVDKPIDFFNAATNVANKAVGFVFLHCRQVWGFGVRMRRNYRIKGICQLITHQIHLILVSKFPDVGFWSSWTGLTGHFWVCCDIIRRRELRLVHLSWVSSHSKRVRHR